jgi:hypothetical protein
MGDEPGGDAPVLGRLVSDLQVGDRLPEIEYVASPFMIREYCHGVEESSERFVGAPEAGQLAVPTLVHIDKLRVLDQACPGGAGPVARLHYEYDAVYHRPIAAGARLKVSAQLEERVERNGRERLVMVFDLRDAATGTLHTTYRDTTLLSYRPRG